MNVGLVVIVESGQEILNIDNKNRRKRCKEIKEQFLKQYGYFNFFK